MFRKLWIVFYHILQAFVHYCPYTYTNASWGRKWLYTYYNIISKITKGILCSRIELSRSYITKGRGMALGNKYPSLFAD